MKLACVLLFACAHAYMHAFGINCHNENNCTDTQSIRENTYAPTLYSGIISSYSSFHRNTVLRQTLKETAS